LLATALVCYAGWYNRVYGRGSNDVIQTVKALYGSADIGVGLYTLCTFCNLYVHLCFSFYFHYISDISLWFSLHRCLHSLSTQFCFIFTHFLSVPFYPSLSLSLSLSPLFRNFVSHFYYTPFVASLSLFLSYVRGSFISLSSLVTHLYIFLFLCLSVCLFSLSISIFLHLYSCKHRQT
jgi:hypothetical protein